MTPCPSPDQLEAYLNDRLSDAEEYSLAAHVQACAACQGQLARLVEDRGGPVAVTLVQVAPAALQPRAGFMEQLVECVLRDGGTGSRDESTRRTAEVLPEVPGYEILEELGRGGMGVVYRARHLKLNRLVALKMILAGEYAEASARARFRAEAEALARLDHPHIVRIYEVGEAGGRLYVVLEYLDAGTLRQHCGKPHSPRLVARLVQTLAEAVHSAHERGVVHRDLKPANILLQVADRRLTIEREEAAPASAGPSAICNLESAILKITDFGLAKMNSPAGPSVHTASGQLMGTPHYMAPEQAEGRPNRVRPAVDIYALGVILYELLTGRPPYDGTTPLEIVLRLLREEVLSPSKLQPSLPRDLVTICLKCLEKEPRKRYQSGAELADDLRRFLTYEPIRARPLGHFGRAWRWCWRRPAAAALLAVSAVGCLAVVGLLLGLWHQERLRGERDIARGERARAEHQRERAEQARYLNNILLAHSRWLENDSAHARRLLDDCPAGLRHWEWHYLHGLAHDDLLTLPGTHVSVTSVAFSPDGSRLYAAGGNPYVAQGDSAANNVKAWDLTGWLTAGDVPLARSFPGKRTCLTCLAVSPDGRLLAAGDSDKTVHVWETSSGRGALSLPPHTDVISRVAFSPDGRLLATTAVDGTVCLWDVRTGRQVRAFRGRKATFSPDSRHVATAGDDVRVHDAVSGEEVRRFPRRADAVAYSPDGALLAVWHGQQAQVLHAAHGGVVFTLSPPGSIMDLTMSPDGRLIAAACADSTVRVWDIRQGREVRVLRGHTGRASCVGFHPKGRLLASGSQQPGDVKVWDLTHQPGYLTAADPHENLEVEALTLEAGRLALARRGGQLQVRDAATGASRLERRIPLTGEWLVPGAVAAFFAGGRRLAGVVEGKAHEVAVWDVTSGAELRRLSGHTLPVVGVVGSRDGRRVVSLGTDWKQTSLRREVKVWDAVTGQLLSAFRAGGSPPLPHRISGCVAVSGDGSRVAFDDCSSKKDSEGKPRLTAVRVRVCDTADGREVHELAVAPEVIRAMTFSPDGGALAVLDATGQVTLHDLTGARALGASVLRSTVQSPAHAAFSPDCRLLAVVDRDQVTVWDVFSGQEVLILRGAPPRSWDPGFNPKVAWSPDGRRLAASNWDRSVSVWDATERVSASAKVRRRREAEERAPSWHRRHLQECQDEGDPFGLAFHRQFLRGKRPPEKR
jgi:WD40 repeat protein